jgi:hypothetical protein
LLQFAEARAGRRGEEAGVESELATALRAFLAGQNLELAEQWEDAMQSYKSVLRCTHELAPTRVAAARVVALTKGHPDLFGPKPAAPAAPAGRVLPGNALPRVIIPAPQPQ